MSERKIYLASGDTLIRTEEGIYFRVNGENGTPLLMDENEGEELAFETAEQLELALEAISNTSIINANLVVKYEEALRKIDEISARYTEKAWALNPDKIQDIIDKALLEEE